MTETDNEEDQYAVHGTFSIGLKQVVGEKPSDDAESLEHLYKALEEHEDINVDLNGNHPGSMRIHEVVEEDD